MRIMQKMSEIKPLSPEAIEKMRIAGQLAADVLNMIGEHVKPGITTDELNTLCHNYIVNEQQATPAPLNYKGFPKSICTSVNHVICHGIPSDKKLKDGDALNIDVTVIKDGYYGDSSKMFVAGEASVLAKRLIKTTQECLYAGIRQVRPGIKIREIGKAIQPIAHKERFSIVEEFCGHGIADVFHCQPNILHYITADKSQDFVLEEGMSFTIEPMINAGKKHMKVLADDWTAVTKDKKLSAQWEHTLLVTKDGVEILTHREEESIDRVLVNV